MFQLLLVTSILLLRLDESVGIDDVFNVRKESLILIKKTNINIVRGKVHSP